MEVFEAVRTVLAVREYDDKPIPPDTVHRIAEAAHLSGSSMNKQPWHFVFVQDKDTLKKLGAAVQTGPYIAQAPLAVAVAVEPNSPFAVSDASRAIQNMVLVAWCEGIGSNWAGFGGLTGAKQLLAIPDEYDVLAVIPFGYPKNPTAKGKKERKPIGEVIHRERFGQPFE